MLFCSVLAEAERHAETEAGGRCNPGVHVLEKWVYVLQEETDTEIKKKGENVSRYRGESVCVPPSFGGMLR